MFTIQSSCLSFSYWHVQVTEVLCTAHMIQFGHLCSLLGTPSGKKGEVLEALMGCGVLVQGCWVVSSHVLYPDSGDAAKRKARDYIVSCLTPFSP